MKKHQIIANDDFEKYNREKSYIPDKLHKKLSPKVYREIDNVFEAHVYVNEEKELWISSLSLHSLLRTSPSNAKYYVQGFRNEDKLEVSGVTFVRIAELTSIIYKLIEKERNFRRRTYLQFSEECLFRLREETKLINSRLKELEYKDDDIKKLKERRIKQYNIIRDELTNEILLNGKESHFSHVRSKTLFPQFATDIENGLIVNSGTHQIITKRMVNDEDDLFNLCIEMGWETGWYKIFSQQYR
jgi:hypothetical protein